MAKHADKLCWLRGLHTDTPAHPQAVVQLHTGSANAALTRPSMGAWLMYGLGTENQDLPGYITINPPPNNSPTTTPLTMMSVLLGLTGCFPGSARSVICICRKTCPSPVIA